ncbi:hypothetical protein Tco_0289315 [Tanacetum coccineum]
MNGSWDWPQSGLHNAHDLGIIPAPVLDISVPDKRQWRYRSGNVMDFSVAKAWEAIRNRRNQRRSGGNKRTAKCIFGKLSVAATAYFIWNERNNKTFKNIRRSPEEIRDIIMVMVRLNNFRIYG